MRSAPRHPLSRARLGLAGLVAALALGVAAPRAARASVPLPADAVIRALDAIARAPRSPESLPRLLALLPALDALSPDAQAAALTRLAAAPSPLVAARARFARMAYAGDAATPGALGLVGPGWWVAADLDADADPATRARAILDSGRVAPGAPPDPDDPERVWAPAVLGPRGAMALDAALTPERDQVVHAAGALCLAVARPVVLRLGVAGDVAVAVDGALVGTASGLAAAELDQIAIPLALAAGPHAVLVTVRPTADAPTLRLRWTDAAGQPLAAPCPTATAEAPLTWTRGADAEAALRPPAELARAPDPWPLVAERALGWPDRGLEDALLVAPDLGDRGPGRGLDPVGFVLAASALPRTEQRMTALAARPDEPLATAALAALALDRGQVVRARELVAALPDSDAARWLARRIARLEPRLPPASAAGEPSGDLADAPPNPAPGTPTDDSERGRVEAARAALAAGRADVAAATFAALVAAIPSPERLDLRASLGRALVAAGRPADAIALARATADARPDRPALALDAVDKTLAGGDDAAGARAALEALTPRLGLRGDQLVAAGRLWEALGEAARAADLYARALVLRPADDEARARLEALRGVEPAPLTIEASAELAALPPLDADAPWEVVAEELVVRVAADGSATRWLRRVLRAQHPPAERDDRTFRWRFDPGRESVRVLGARVRQPDGTTSAVKTREIRTAAEDWFGLYYDVRVLSIPFDGLVPGSLVEVTLRIDAVGQLFPGVFELLEVLQDRVPKHRHRIAIEAPTALGLRSKLLAPADRPAPGALRRPMEGGGLVREAREPMDGGRERLVVEARDLPALPVEALAPGAAEASPAWQVSTFASWSDVAHFYADLLATQVHPTSDMKARVAAIQAAEGGDPRRVARALVALVQHDIRYVGLEFGIHGYKPYRTDQVWTRRFGDCKDQALLLRTLLAEAGVPADVVLVRTRPQGRLADPLPSLAIFDHAIVRLRERSQLVDSTVVRQGMDDLPAADQGAQALVIDPDASALVTTPVDAATRNQIVGAYAVTLAPSGQGGIQGTVALHGAQAPYYRELLADPATRHDQLQALLNRRYPGLALQSARVSDLDRLDAPVELVFEALVPRLAGAVGATLQVARPAGIDGQAERVAPTPTRAQPVVLGAPMTFDLTFRYMPPTGWRPAVLPASAAAESPFGRWSVRWTELGGVITVHTELAWTTDQVEVADYPALRSFIRAFDAAVGPTLVLEPGP